MNYNEKIYKFKMGYWRAPTPPVPTNLWTNHDWVAYIDLYKGWF